MNVNGAYQLTGSVLDQPFAIARWHGQAAFAVEID